jgi:hypothetical protein
MSRAAGSAGAVDGLGLSESMAPDIEHAGRDPKPVLGTHRQQDSSTGCITDARAHTVNSSQAVADRAALRGCCGEM